MIADPGDSSLARQIAKRIKTWLADPAARSRSLVDWLEGYDFPAVGSDDEPFVWLHRGLDELDDGDRGAFVGRLAQFLDERPDVTRPGDRPDEVLYNLLMLCARLGRCDPLGPPLRRMYERAVRREGLKGEAFRGLDLRDPLLLALVANQHDRGLVPVWFRMLETGGDEILPGTAYSGFYGVLLADQPGQPDIKDLGRALTIMVAYLEEMDGKFRPKLAELLDRIYQMHPAQSSELDHSFLLHAMWGDWPRWAASQLRRRWIALREGPKIIAWREIWDELPAEFRGEVADFRGDFVEVRIESTEFDLFDSVGRNFDDLLRSNPYKSRRSVLGILNMVLIDLEIRFKSLNPDTAGVITSTRKLLRSRIGPMMPRDPNDCLPPLDDRLSSLIEDGTCLAAQANANPSQVINFCSHISAYCQTIS